MKSGQFFWGFLLLAIGSLFLFTKYDIIYSDFCFVWDIWPLLFVFWGALVIFKNSPVRQILSAIFGIFLAVMIFGIAANIFSGFRWSEDRDELNREYSETFSDSTKYAELTLNSGAGKFLISGITDNLVNGKSYGTFADYKFDVVNSDSATYINFSLHENDFNPFDGKIKNQIEIALNSNPIWDFDLEFGAAKTNFDLSDYKVRNVQIGTGASSVILKLGDKYDETNVEIGMGAAKIKIYVPKESGCSVKGDMVLMSRDLDDLRKIDSGYYETPNYDEAINKIDIRVDGGVSSFKVIRY